jgi:hypothetical protein
VAAVRLREGSACGSSFWLKEWSDTLGWGFHLSGAGCGGSLGFLISFAFLGYCALLLLDIFEDCWTVALVDLFQDFLGVFY